MIQVNLANAKTNLSRYVKLAASGERVVICDRNVPVAELQAIASPRPTGLRRLGFLDKSIWLADDAFEPLYDAELTDWYGSD